MQRVFVPQSVIEDPQQPKIWIVAELNNGKGVAQQRSIKLGSAVEDGWIEVVGGLSVGSKVITTYETLKEGDVVELAGDQD